MFVGLGSYCRRITPRAVVQKSFSEKVRVTIPVPCLISRKN